MRSPDLLAPPGAGLRQRLADAVRAQRPRQGLARVEVPLPPTDPLAWLAAQPAPRRVFWEGREGTAAAACGEVLTVEAGDLDTGSSALAPRLEALPDGARVYGTCRFAPRETPDDAWAPFGRVRFVLPRVELRVGADGATLALHLTPDDDEASVAAVLDALAVAPPPLDLSPPAVRGREDAPDAEGWAAAVRWALTQFEAGGLEKVVFARRARFAFDRPLDPFALLAHLRAATPGSYHTLVGAGGAAFVGASPERLFRVDGRRVETEAVAGTRPLTREASADRRLHADLLASEKDRREHAYVADAIAAALGPLTEGLDRDGAPATLDGAGVQHLYTRLTGRLRDGVSSLAVLRALHPTPAVGGTPTDEALDAIGAHEPFDRGLYAGPGGWVGRDAAEFAVGIRSGLVRGATLDLFSGAGLVAGSDPAAEWAEIEHKLSAFRRVLGLDHGG